MNLTLDEVAFIKPGYSWKSSLFSDSPKDGHPIIRIQNLGQNNNARLVYYKGEVVDGYWVEPGEILVSLSGSFKVYLWDGQRALLNQRIVAIRPKPNINQKFLFAQLLLLLNKIRQSAQGIAVANATIGSVRNLQVDIPPLPEQERIVRLLDEAEALRTQRAQANERMEDFVPALFNKMFGKSKKLRVAKIGELTQVKTGGTPSRKEPKYFEGNIPWVKTTEVKQSVILDTEEKITQEAIKNSNCEIFPPETILLAMYGQGITRGRTGKLGISATTNQACAAILPSNEFDTDYLWTFLQMSYEKLRNLGRGGNQPNLNLSIVKNFEVTLPPLDLQQEFAERVKEAREIQSAQGRSTERVEALYQSMLDRAFKGEL